MAILDLATYKAYAGISSTTEDAKHTLIINAVNTFIEEYCGRVFTTYYDTEKVEYYSTEDSDIFPIEHPVVEIVSLDYSTDGGATYSETLVEYTDYILDKEFNHRIVSLYSAFKAGLIKPMNALRLTYKGGYAAVPKDLELVAVHLTDYYKDSDYVPRKSLAGASVDTIIIPDRTARLPAHIRRVLEFYRNIVI